MRYQIIVENIGTVFTGNFRKYADERFDEYVKLSKSGSGSAANSEVTMLDGAGNILRGYSPDR